METTGTSPGLELKEPERSPYGTGAAMMRRAARDLRASGRLPDARSIYRRLEAAAPNDHAILFESAQIHELMGDKVSAVELLHRCVVLKPESAEYHNAFGAILCDLGRPTEALDVLDGALSLDPALAEAHCNRGIALNMAGHGEEAMRCWLRALELRPGHGMAQYCIGEALLHGGDALGSIGHLREAIRLSPKLAGAYLCLTTALQRLGRIEEALPLSRQAMRLRPVWSVCHTNLGALLQMQGRLDDAIASYGRAIELDPVDPRPRRNRAYAYLKKGDFEHGWAEHEWRQVADIGVSPGDDLGHPVWNGCSLKDRTLLVRSEQGLGDTIQFVRFLPVLASQGAKIVFECQPRLVPLLRCTPELGTVIARGEALPPFDTYVFLMSIPSILRLTVDGIPSAVPYLRAPPPQSRGFTLQDRGRFHVGIVWQGNKTSENDCLRSIPLKEFASLAQVPDVGLVSLQKFDGADQVLDVGFPVHRLSDDMDSRGAFVDTASALLGMDLIISCDTAIAHLAAALGRPVWIAICHAADWRWMLDRADSPWYPTVRLFRQTALGDWQSVFAEMASALREKVRTWVPSDQNG